MCVRGHGTTQFGETMKLQRNLYVPPQEEVDGWMCGRGSFLNEWKRARAERVGTSNISHHVTPVALARDIQETMMEGDERVR